jgi:hypothetical protein
VGRLLVAGLAVAGLGAASFSDATEPATSQSAPVRLSAGLEARVYATDTRAKSVSVFDRNLNLMRRIPCPDKPLGIAVDKQGLIYVGDEDLRGVAVYDANGQKLRVIGEGQITKPNDLVFDLAGNLYVADSLSDVVRVYSPAGTAVRTIGSSGSDLGQFKFPAAVAIAYYGSPGQLTGELFVADQGNWRVQVFDLAGNYLRKFGSQVTSGMGGTKWKGRFVTLQSLAVDDQYRVHAVDSYMNNVQILNAQTGSFIDAYGAFGTNVGQLNLPLDILITDSAQVLIANYGNGRVEPVQVMTNLVVVLSNSTVNENVGSGTPVGTLSVTPPATNSITYALVEGPGDDDNGLFQINGATLQTAAAFDYETKSACHIRVKAIGPTPLNFTYAQPLTILIGDVNESPTGVALDNTSIQEGLAVGSVVGRLKAVDPDQTDTFSYALVPGPGDEGNAFFQINGDQLLTAAVLKHQTAASYNLRVQVTDSAGQTSTSQLTVTVSPVYAIDLADSNSNGLPDWWELLHFGSTTGANPATDDDGDGVTNFQEWIAGTNPTNPSDKLAITSFTMDPASGQPVLGWPSAFGRLYDIEYTENLQLPFANAQSDLPASPPFNVWQDTAPRAPNSGFYRLKVRLNLQTGGNP